MTTPHATDTTLWVEWVRRVCGTPAIYMDIGAGDAFDAALVADAFSSTRVIAFEPFEDVVVHPRVEVIRVAVGAATGHAPFHIKAYPACHGLYDRGSEYGTRVMTAPVTTLAEWAARRHIAAVDAVKIDVEGAAWDVLAGAGPLLDTIRVLHIETETRELFAGQHLEDEVFTLLAASGMTMVHRAHVDDLGQGDSIWTRQ